MIDKTDIVTIQACQQYSTAYACAVYVSVYKKAMQDERLLDRDLDRIAYNALKIAEEKDFFFILAAVNFMEVQYHIKDWVAKQD